MEKYPYSKGDRFVRSFQGRDRLPDEYVLCSVDSAAPNSSMVALISTTSWNRWRNPSKVNCPCNISEEELEAIVGKSNTDKFVRVFSHLHAREVRTSS